MKIRIYRNTARYAPRWGRAYLPRRQYLYWLGPLFVHIRGGA